LFISYVRFLFKILAPGPSSSGACEYQRWLLLLIMSTGECGDVQVSILQSAICKLQLRMRMDQASRLQGWMPVKTVSFFDSAGQKHPLKICSASFIVESLRKEDVRTAKTSGNTVFSQRKVY